jgi:hypothetical protein
MTHRSEITHEFNVYVEGVPAPIINKVISEAFHLYYKKHEDELCMSEMNHDEFMEIATAFQIATANVDYSCLLDDYESI